MNSSIGFKIKKLREQKEISQEDLAFRLDVSQSYLSKIENGAIEKLDFMFMQKVADFFKVEPQYFLEGDTIVNNNIETSNNSSVGNIGDTTINSTDQNLLENVINNQHQINQLMEMQNKLIEKLLKN
ncbi:MULTISPECIES: helix-turn-helix domain-containing protein [Chryseobacterium]|uniref:Transcriptional regulator with XRE-family HTH domain n=1 Tax=Chryseobacterium camelliae TaxID=1265445 RepID=A0ABU0TIU5_9FLAO|nr:MULTISPECIES: helix-turn-helix transcriptional regulator [Chryseobacterium]MDT3409168.1 transcriptional regulator with XRE-family HTH domain [Pseudacidovorax intermedius]MDQ1096971.1 transcriptional regulator with XRE-family HTH domain [Chryseobacterium camelliae]MDQ1100912.1 transcriptional regulator with XRE-family HTH domain [Chryseobacterium sp. SORGH_AS_1048]MDR6084355.1 transcriptional regulator with XRE-family HTH domain [Chryseobacterium sp. SORGH_AS_0909]MDR6132626.1 transcriptiona